MRIDIITIFPEIFESPMRASLLGKAIDQGIAEVHVHDLRTFADDPRVVDDESFGGGPGMVLKPEPIFAAVRSLPAEPAPRAIVLSPAGRRMDQGVVKELAAEAHLVLICGRYEGVDERVVDGVPAEELSIGDYVLSGGEIPALVVVEAVTRLLPGVVGRTASIEQDSFEEGILDHPHYTRPASFEGMDVPDVLRSGDHGAIATWRKDAAEAKTRRNRPDLLQQ